MDNTMQTLANKMTRQLKLITPELAEEMLSMNLSNRSLNEGLVQAYANDMKSGRWVEALSSIVFSNNLLLDGQHRLHAVIKSKRSIVFEVIENAPLAAQAVIDTGAARTAGNVLQINGVANSNNIAAMIRSWAMTNRIAKKLPRPAKEFTNAQILTEYNNRPEFWQQMYSELKSISRETAIVPIGLAGGVGAYCFDKYGSYDFIKAVCAGDESYVNAKMIYNFFLKSKIRKRFIHPTESIPMLLKYMDYYAKNKQVSRIKVL